MLREVNSENKAKDDILGSNLVTTRLIWFCTFLGILKLIYRFAGKRFHVKSVKMDSIKGTNTSVLCKSSYIFTSDMLAILRVKQITFL